MFRLTASQISKALRGAIGVSGRVGTVRAADGHDIPAKEFGRRYGDYFNHIDIDGWETRKGLNNLLGMDLVPDPKIVDAALKVCRRVNDIVVGKRWLEGVKDKCGDKTGEIYPYVINSIRSTLIEFGVPTPKELNCDIPEFTL